MRRLAILTAATALALASPAGAAVLRFRASTTAHTIRVPGKGQTLQLDRISVDGQTILLADVGHGGPRMYGQGVALQFLESTRTDAYSIRVVALAGDPQVAVRYHFTTWPPAPLAS